MINSSTLEKIFRYIVSLIFFVPLLVFPAQFIFPFIVPKILVFRSLVLCLLIAYILLCVAGWKDYRPRWSYINLGAGLFFFSFLISTFTGVDWYKSFWDNHERMLGLFTLIHYGIFYLTVTSVVRDWEEWKKLAQVFILPASLVMVIGLLQKISPEMLLNRGAERVSATLGNPIYLGGYGLFLFFLSLLFWKIEESSFWKWLFGIAGTLGFLGIFLSGTRGAFLGLVAGLSVSVFTYAVALPNHPRVRRYAFIILLSTVALFGVLYAYRKVPFIRAIPALGPLLNVELKGGSVGTRIMAWGVGFQAWKERPIFGWGPNNYYFAFNAHYKPEFLEYGWGETWFDNAHNILVNTLAVQGLFGVSAYLFLFVAVLWAVWSAYKAGKANLWFASIVTGFFAGHFTQNNFVFENPTSYLFFFFFLALVNAATEKKILPLRTSGKVSFGAAIVVSALIFVFLYGTNINAAKANMASLDAIRTLYAGGDAKTAYESVAKMPSPHIDDIRTDFSRISTEILPKYLEAKRFAEADWLLNNAYEAMDQNRALHPLDVRYHILQAQVAQSLFERTRDIKWLVKSEEIITDGLVKSPRRQQLEYFLADIQFALGKYNKAEATLRDSIQRDKKIDEGWARLQILLERIGQHEKAVAVAKEALANGIPLNPNFVIPKEALATTTKNK